MTYAVADHTGSASVSFAGDTTLTGGWATAGYRPEAQRALLDRAPLRSMFKEPIHKWVEKLAGTPAADLLADLHTRFRLSWRQIAQLLGFSVRSVNKWREGGGMTGESYLALRRLVAFCEVASMEGAEDLDAWMGTYPITDIPVDRAELYAAGAIDALLRSVDGSLSLDVLDRWIPRWREKVALQGPPLHLQIAFDTDGAVVASVEELPDIVAVGSSVGEARRELVGVLRDYANDWIDHLHAAPNHAPYRGVVRAIREADDGQLLRYLDNSG